MEEIRQEIITMYKEHAPKHLGEVDSTMEEWAGELRPHRSSAQLKLLNEQHA